jgi:hypothetical protein
MTAAHPRARQRGEGKLAWLLGSRRLTVRYERRADLLTAFRTSRRRSPHMGYTPPLTPAQATNPLVASPRSSCTAGIPWPCWVHHPGPYWVGIASGTAGPRWARAVTVGESRSQVAGGPSLRPRTAEQRWTGFEPLTQQLPWPRGPCQRGIANRSCNSRSEVGALGSQRLWQAILRVWRLVLR